MTEPPEPPRLELNVALRRYWKHLIGVALFPIVAFAGIEIFHLPFGALIPVFFAVNFLAAWPYLARRAPYTFWLTAMGVWMAAAFVGLLLLQLLRFILALQTT
jgi:hypothetical protein